MPIHDWKRVTPGTFHAFHLAWIAEMQKSLNGGLLPDGYYAMAEQVAGDTVPDTLTLQGSSDAVGQEASDDDGGIAVAVSPPRTRYHEHLTEARVTAAMRRRITIRHTTGDRIVALIEIVSFGNKNSRDAVDKFVGKAASALDHGYHLLVIDLFAPGSFDPDGIHGSIWSYFGSEYTHPADKPLTLAAYASREPQGIECYVEPTAVGSPLIDMPIFLTPGRYVNVPLEQTYLAAYEGVPKRWKRVIEK